MRPIAFALTAAGFVAAATLAYGRTEMPAPGSLVQAGTLTCTSNPDASLVFGRTPVAECRFVSDRGDLVQSYGAILTQVGKVSGEMRAETWTWRVMTRDGASRAAMLDGSFTPLATPAPRGPADLARGTAGETAVLQLVSHSGRSRETFSVAHPRVDLAALSPAAR